MIVTYITSIWIFDKYYFCNHSPVYLLSVSLQVFKTQHLVQVKENNLDTLACFTFLHTLLSTWALITMYTTLLWNTIMWLLSLFVANNLTIHHTLQIKQQSLNFDSQIDQFVFTLKTTMFPRIFLSSHLHTNPCFSR